MAMQEYEPTPNDMTPVKRYFNDLYYKKYSYIDLQIAAEKLLQTEGLDSQSYDGLYGTVLPTPDQFGNDHAAGFDKFLILPFDVVGSWVDATRPMKEVSEWYESTAKGIRDATRENHSDGCYAVSAETPMSCDCSFICPRKFMASRLILPTTERNFDTVEYLVDPFRSRALALEKLDTAKRLNMITVPQYLGHTEQYLFAFDDRFGPEPVL